MDTSAAEISRITDSVLPAVQEWRNHPIRSSLSLCIPGLYVFKVRINGISSGDNIKKIREQKGILQKQLAADVNIPYISYKQN